MSTRATAVGRGLACVGVAGGLASVCARVLVAAGRGPLWLSVPALAVEVLGVLAAAVLVWAAFAPAGPGGSAGRAPVGSTDIVVRVGDQESNAIRATLIASRELGPVTVIDLRGRTRAAALAREYGARYVTARAGDLNGLTRATEVCDRDTMLLLDAGDVPAPGILDRLWPLLARPGVAIVQGMSEVATADSPEQLASGRRERDFERHVLNPWLGARGCAMFTGSGALVRRGLVAEIAPLTASAAMAEAEVTAALFAGGWKVVAPSGDPVVVLRGTASPDEWEAGNAGRASAARHLVFGLHGALGVNRLRPGQRLAMLAWSVRPLSGVRRGLFLVVLLGCLLAGRVPYVLPPTQLALTMVFFAITPIGLALATGGVLRPGDRCRFSMRTLGASWRGLLSPNARPVEPRRALAGAVGVDHEVASAAAVGLLAVVLGMRGFSDRITHTLQPLPRRGEVGLLVVALWLLAAALESQRLLAGSRRKRSAVRVPGRLHGELSTPSGDDAHHRSPVAVIDLSASGASVLGSRDLPTGPGFALELELPDALGAVRRFTIASRIRHAQPAGDGRVQYGVEFTVLDRPTADALVRHCVVVPARTLLATVPSRRRARSASLTPPLVPGFSFDALGSTRRSGLRAAALVALAGALASAGAIGPGRPSSALTVTVIVGLIGLGLLIGALPRRAARTVKAGVVAHSLSPDLAMR